ncbi:UNVERIFIED_CONTAM: hypothetical protein NCL1_09576 [Trichonephila clavipes]
MKQRKNIKNLNSKIKALQRNEFLSNTEKVCRFFENVIARISLLNGNKDFLICSWKMCKVSINS